MDTLLQEGLLEIQRLAGYETQYVQSVVAEYFLKPVDKRNAIRRSLRILRGHLRATVNSLFTVLDRLAQWDPSTSAAHRDGYMEAWEDRVRATMTNTLMTRVARDM